MMTKLEAKNILEDIIEAISVAVDSIDVGEDYHEGELDE